jgi:hypothetical protein
LHRVLNADLAHHSVAGPHRGLNVQVSVLVSGADHGRATDSAIERLDVLGGLIHHYSPAARSSRRENGLGRFEHREHRTDATTVSAPRINILNLCWRMFENV